MLQLVLAAPRSGSGKTTAACALLAALQARGEYPCAFKSGPDYIDPMFHRAVLGVESHNLDLFFSTPATVRRLYAQNAAGHGAAVVEGAMGYYDGLGGTSATASAWHLADTLGLPVLLVVRPKGASLTLAAELRGLMAFRTCLLYTSTITPTMTSNALHIIPRIAVLGIGCKRGTPADKLADAFAAFCAETKLAPQSIAAAASIDLKKDELGLAEFGQKQGWPVTFYTADELRAAPGQFAHSDFVQSITGVDNVCERAAVLAAGGPVWAHKWARDGVTFAVALRPFTPDWRWNDD